MSSASRICKIEEASLSSRKLALLRIDSFNAVDASLDKNDEGCFGGLASELNRILQQALLNSTDDPSELLKVLKIVDNVTTNDETLAEEIDTSEGFRDCLQKVLLLLKNNGNNDVLFKSIHELATSIETSMAKLETVDKTDPFSDLELQSRLPLMFGISQKNQKRSDLEIMIHQVTSEEETETHDTGYVMWPSAVILARYLTENPSLVVGRTEDDVGDILELGAGCGLSGLVAAALLRQHSEEYQARCEESKDESDDPYANVRVILTDYLPAVLENIERNLWLNGFDKNSGKVAGLDFFDQPGNDDSHYDASQPNWIDMTGTKQPQVQLVLAADVLPYSNDAVNVANTIYAALVEGGNAVVVSAGENKRFGVADFPEACRNAGLEITMARSSAVGLGNSIGEGVRIEDNFSSNLEQTVGYDDEVGYDFLIFKIVKPLASH